MPPQPGFPPPMMASDNGLPAYTLPPSSGAPAHSPDWAQPFTGRPAEAGDGVAVSFRGADAPFGVGATGGGRQPFGGSAAQISTPPSWSPEAGAQDHPPVVPVPQQRGQGTVYGGFGQQSPIDMTMPVSMNPVENSGSLTGHILAQGWDHGPDTNRRSNTKVAIAMLLVLVVLVGVSLLFLLTFGSAFTDWITGIFGG
jgi:hypothetical protein